MPTMNTSSYEMDWERKKEICPLCNGEGGNWNNDVYQMEPCTCGKEPIPYNVSEWKEEGKRRGYFDYFAKEEREKVLRKLMDIMKKENLESDAYNNFYIDLCSTIKDLLK